MTIEQRSYPITVDYTKSLAEMVGAGKYGYVDEDITSQSFPITGTGIVDAEIILVHFDCCIESDGAVRELNEMGLKPALIEYLLALGAKHPDLQREYPIVALGSVWVRRHDHRYVSYLVGSSRRRDLHLRWTRYDWRDYCRFLAVPASA